MGKLEVFDPAMCCSTGVCGTQTDSVLPRVAADLEWLRSRGVEVRRYNLAQEPLAFTENPQVKSILDETGGDGLPAFAINGRVVHRGDYPDRTKLAALVGIDANASSGATASAHTSGGCCGSSENTGCC